MQPVITLLGTSHCHLCEQAEHRLNQMGLNHVKIDIMDLASGIERYGTKIPVLTCQGKLDLAWPFSLLDIARWYQSDKDYTAEIAGKSAFT